MYTDQIPQQIENLQNHREKTLARLKLRAHFIPNLLRALRLRFDERRIPVDLEIAASSGLRNGLKVIEEGGFQGKTSPRDELFNLMLTAARRRVLNQLRDAQAQKRPPIQRLADLPEGTAGDGGASVLEHRAGRELPPELWAEAVEECERLFGLLPDDRCRRVVELKADGFKNEEIAKELRCSVSTVEIKLALTRGLWKREAARE